MVADGATTVPTAVPAGTEVVAAADSAGVGVMVVVNGTALLVGKGPSDAVTVSPAVAV